MIYTTLKAITVLWHAGVGLLCSAMKWPALHLEL